MTKGNVCKFNFNRSSDLICLNFIKEISNSQAQASLSEHYAIHLVISGTGVLNRNGIDFGLKQGDIFFLCRGDRFFIRSQNSLKYYYICYQGRRADEFVTRFGLDRKDSFFSDYTSLIPFWNECQELASADNIDLICESVITYSLSKLNFTSPEVNDIVAKILEITQRNFTDPDLSITYIANELNYNSKYLSSLFTKSRGVTYTQYLREQRIKHSVFLMEQGVVSVKNVAILSGFRDALYFSKVFTAVEGISPKAYIQKVLSKEDFLHP